MTVAQLRTAALRAGTIRVKCRELWHMAPENTPEADLAWHLYLAAQKTHDHLMALWTATADRKKENRK